MRFLIGAAFAVASLAAMPVIVVTPANALSCTDDVPAGWQRPGGYCDQAVGAGGGTSLSPPVTDTPSPPPCPPRQVSDASGELFLLAAAAGCPSDNCGPISGELLINMQIGDRIRVAVC